MIKASELRIGNFFDYGGQNVVVLEIKRNQNVIFGYYKDSIGFERILNTEDCPKPIITTEKKLIEFGFQKEEGYDRFFYVSKCDYSVRFLFKNGKCYLADINGDADFIELYYFHQIQNLYFSLTKNELKIKTNE